MPLYAIMLVMKTHSIISLAHLSTQTNDMIDEYDGTIKFSFRINQLYG